MNIVDFRVLMVDETLNSIRVDQWRLMTPEQRDEFLSQWARRGQIAYGCFGCGYPVHHGGNCGDAECGRKDGDANEE